jgi:peptide deformylase
MTSASETPRAAAASLTAALRSRGRYTVVFSTDPGYHRWCHLWPTECTGAGHARSTGRYHEQVAELAIRTYGDPVLRQVAQEVEEVDGRVAQLAEEMIETMYAAPGVGLAAPQVGVRRRLFVWDTGDGRGPRVVVNPRIVETSGTWTYEEGCLSVPGLFWPITRPKDVHLVGVGLDGEEISIEASELEARVFLHEVDHLDGVLLVERLDPDQRREAKRLLAERALTPAAGDPDGLGQLLDPLEAKGIRGVVGRRRSPR